MLEYYITTTFKLYSAMQNNWETMKEDIKIAKQILESHFKCQEASTMVIQKHTVSQEGCVKIERSEWVIDIENTMIRKHGKEKGIQLTNKIISGFIIKDETIH